MSGNVPIHIWERDMAEILHDQQKTSGTIKADRADVSPNPNQLLSRDEVEQEFRLTRRWLELAALNGEGPPFVRVSSRMVRYQRATLENWIADRTRTSTSDHANK